jgi:hypothetical protein
VFITALSVYSKTIVRPRSYKAPRKFPTHSAFRVRHGFLQMQFVQTKSSIGNDKLQCLVGRSTERIHAGHAECSYSALLALGETPIFGEGQFLRVDEFFAHNIKVTEMVLKHNATHAALDKNIPWSCLFIFHKLALHIHPRSASRISMSSENVAAVDAKNSCAFRFFLCLR